ncbi:polysaccharide transporter, PST family [Quadrisphaera granulorum]|uniref:PST family polysaccharide transporter n=1 Tax=Quadrisphaera granulorum TaxID=317664 RepID=A0A315ZTJ9_9ACTN|nr:lipopolysaccharide biosynthesis protein [Quadrisphaera granulorum]PWJ48642.1 PST family polysaccharide transporter [Quadrisphaera granulorum]SZE98364.1 polysaccharide transporter, PST family [Quadrisphaera granulorum]
MTTTPARAASGDNAEEQAPPVTGRRAARGAVVTSAGQAVRIVIQLAGIVILARLLDPSDYGVVTMVVAITGIGEVLRDFGLSSAAVQARTLSLAERTNLFWFNTASGALLTLLAFAASWPIAAAYGDPRLQLIGAAMSVTFILNGLATQHRADLTRKMRFVALSGVDVSAQLVGLTVAIIAAAAGASYWALVLQQVVAAAVQLVVAVCSTRWIPGPPRRDTSLRPFLSFGSSLAAVQMLGYASRNVDSVVIGATAGPAALGLYNRAFQLMMMPLLQINAPSTRVALPTLSRLQDDPVRFAAFVRTGQATLLSITSLVLALVAAQADAVVQLALGPAWSGVVEPFRILAVAGFAATAGYATYWVILAKGLTTANLKFALVARPLMILCICAGGLWGVTGVATAYAVSSLVLWPIQLSWLGRFSDAPTRMMFLNGLRIFVAYTFAAVVSWGTTFLLREQLSGSAAAALLVGGLALLLAVGIIAAVVPAFRRDLGHLLLVARRVGGRRRVSRSQATTGEE